MLVILINEAVMMITGHLLPMITWQMNKIVVFNDLMILVITLHMMLYTQWVPDESTKFYYGWHMIFHIILLIAFNLYFVLKFASRQIFLVCKKYYRRARNPRKS